MVSIRNAQLFLQKGLCEPAYYQDLDKVVFWCLLSVPSVIFFPLKNIILIPGFVVVSYFYDLARVYEIL